MSERWMPKTGETYYFFDSLFAVGSYAWRDDGTDAQYQKSGNCFRTEAEAEATAEKVKALLLSLHDNNLATNLQDKKNKLQDKPLPKLTAEVFDRPDCPEDVKIAVVNKNGSAFWGSFNTAKPDFLGGWVGENGSWFSIPGKWDSSDWQNSLIERPVKETKLPDWCEVDAICWHKRCGYFKVTYIDDVSKRVDIQQVKDKSKGYLSFHTVCNEVLQAHLRPYNEVEMRGLVGMVVCRGSSIHFVTGYEEALDGESMVHVNGCLYNANDLLQKGFTYDTRPCGRLEHLENRKWVK